MGDAASGSGGPTLEDLGAKFAQRVLPDLYDGLKELVQSPVYYSIL